MLLDVLMEHIMVLKFDIIIAKAASQHNNRINNGVEYESSLTNGMMTLIITH